MLVLSVGGNSTVVTLRTTFYTGDNQKMETDGEDVDLNPEQADI
jgi:hypothetical protein